MTREEKKHDQRDVFVIGIVMGHTGAHHHDSRGNGLWPDRRQARRLRSLRRTPTHRTNLCPVVGGMRAAAALRLGKSCNALADFREALGRSVSNLRTRAICLLRMAELHSKADNSELASRCFREWAQIKPHVSSVYLRRLERSAQSAIESASADFDLDWHRNVERIQAKILTRLRGQSIAA